MFRSKITFKNNFNTRNIMTSPRINLIVAVDSKWGISKQNNIPWKIKEDSCFFQDVTKRSYDPNKKNAIIMGKNTWKALPDAFRGLKDRINIVISSSMSDKELDLDNVTKSEAYIAKTLDNAMELCNKINPGKIFIGGGSNIYKEALDKYNIDEIYLSQVKDDYNCDNIFPNESLILKLSQYKKDTEKTFKVNDENSKKNVDITFTKFYKNGLPQLNKNLEEQQYLDLLEDIIKTGHFRQTRNSKTWSKFGKNLEFDLSKGFPILTTKKVFFRGVFEELLFFLKGDTNAKHLSEKGVKIWDANTSREFLDSVGLKHYEEGDMGNLYGYNWLHFGFPYKGMNYDYTGKGFNQIEYCLKILKTDPYSRRILMTSYDAVNAYSGTLFPCHSLICQWYVEDNNRLSLSCYNRSQDFFLGNPFNQSSSSLLIHLFCEVINNDQNYKGPKFTPGRLIMNLGDVHVYENHYSEVIRQILREPYNFPQLIIKRKVTDLTDFKFEDLELNNYECYPNIVAKMVA